MSKKSGTRKDDMLVDPKDLKQNVGIKKDSKLNEHY